MNRFLRSLVVIIEAAVFKLDDSGRQRCEAALRARAESACVFLVERIQLRRARARAHGLIVVITAAAAAAVEILMHRQQLGASSFHLRGRQQRGGRRQTSVRVVFAIALDALFQPPTSMNLTQLRRRQAAQSMQIIAVLRDDEMELAALLELERGTEVRAG